MRRPVVAAAVLAVTLVMVAGAVVYHFEHGPTRQQSFIRELTAAGVSRFVRIEVRAQPDAVIAAGGRACGWAKTHPWDDRDDDPVYRYAKTVGAPDLIELDEAQDVAAAAWRHLCPGSHMLPEDD